MLVSGLPRGSAAGELFFCGYDLDSELPLKRYSSEALRSERGIRPAYHRKLRVVPAHSFLLNFASDRSHMKNSDGSDGVSRGDVGPQCRLQAADCALPALSLSLWRGGGASERLQRCHQQPRLANQVSGGSEGLWLLSAAPFISTQDQVWIHFISNRDSDTGKGFRLSYVTGSLSAPGCDVDQFHCSNGKCVPDWWRCNSMDECGDNSDEELCLDSPSPSPPAACTSSPACPGSVLWRETQELLRFLQLPQLPRLLPPGSNCSWTIDTGDPRKVVLRFTDFKLDGTGYGDYVKVYDGLEENPRRLLRVLTAFDSRAPVAVLRIHFYADKINAARGFNATYQVSGRVLPALGGSLRGNWGCYTEQQRCDGYWHCPNGRDELNCSSCQEDEFPCSRNGACYPRSDRCNYQNRCPNGSDEKNCFFCQPGNFHCKNNRCVFESWVCDAQDDCGDGSDEESCPVIVPTRVITAASDLRSAARHRARLHLQTLLAAHVLRDAAVQGGGGAPEEGGPALLRSADSSGSDPPVEDFPVCSGNQASVLENLRLAVRSQLGFTSLRLPSSGRHSNLWRRLFTFPRSRRSGSLALVSADLEDGGSSNSSDLLSPDSDPETEASEGGRGRVSEGGEGRRGRRGSAGRRVVPWPPSLRRPRHQLVWRPWFPHPDAGLCPDPGGPAPFQPVATVTSGPDPECHGDAPEAPPPSALQRLAQNLSRLAHRLRTGPQDWTNHSPLRQLETGRGGAQAGEQRNREEEEDVELLIPVSDSDSASSSSLDVRQPLMEPHPCYSTSHAPHHHRGNVGPCEHCGIVHTALIPDACRGGRRRAVMTSCCCSANG
ncbi:hypothetical protein F7725_024609 [Dissostichus mawsoni]|uniref:WDYHV motif-containing protein 1 n=1 Tax=Dissostichus mawsoni TaxID=36200 RepID=A0A7J5X8U5_DISMA|nr:hypothetical protein F7725_024609 [Dissostichus mawsoni]